MVCVGISLVIDYINMLWPTCTFQFPGKKLLIIQTTWKNLFSYIYKLKQKNRFEFNTFYFLYSLRLHFLPLNSFNDFIILLPTVGLMIPSWLTSGWSI